jgi:hypothetical protein
MRYEKVRILRQTDASGTTFCAAFLSRFSRRRMSSGFLAPNRDVYFGTLRTSEYALNAGAN